MASDADGILNTYLPMTADLIGRLPRARIIARYGIGVDNVDLDAASRAGITVTNVPDYSVQEVAAHAVALMLGLIRRIPQADSLVRSGAWGIDGLRPIRRISELTFGLIGLGRIARQVAASIEALGGRLIASDPFVGPAPGLPTLVSLDDLIADSDIISVHAPLTPETRGLFDATRLARMRRGAILVNTARGPLVVLDDLVESLRSGHLGGAGLDVFDTEPLDPSRIAGVPNLLVTPHMAYYSEESLLESQRKAATQVVKVLTGLDPDYPIHR
jgi:D-3-phosphoglycerate dehydrogenase